MFALVLGGNFEVRGKHSFDPEPIHNTRGPQDRETDDTFTSGAANLRLNISRCNNH